MNKVYKVIWNKVRNCYMVVSEIAKRNGKCSSSLNKKIIASFLAAGLVTALPINVSEAADFKPGKAGVTTAHYQFFRNGKPVQIIFDPNESNRYRAYDFNYDYDGKHFSLVHFSSESSLEALENRLRSGEYSTVTYTSLNSDDTTNNAFGYYAIAGGKNSTAFGDRTYAIGLNATAFGHQTYADGNYTTAFGSNTYASGESATAFGFRTIADANQATAFGHWTKATANRATAFGIETTASGRNSTSFGHSTTASGENATAFGSKTIASGGGATAFGRYTEARADNSVAWGSESVVDGGHVKLGDKTYIDLETLRYTDTEGDNTHYYIMATDSATGERVRIAGRNNDDTIIAGGHKYGDGDEDAFIGPDQGENSGRNKADDWIKKQTEGRVAGQFSTAFGDKSKVYARNALGALGGTVNGGADNSAAIGKNANVSSENAYAIGNNATIGMNSNGSVALGGQDKDSKDSMRTTIGSGATNAFAAVGGTVNTDAINAIAIGTGAKAEIANSVALGSGSVSKRGAGLDAEGNERNGYDLYNAVGGITTDGESLSRNSVWRSTRAGISVGDTANNITRRIEGVAAGWEETDAVNVAQLKNAAVQLIAGDGISVTPAAREGGGIQYKISLIGGGSGGGGLTSITSDNRAVAIDNSKEAPEVSSPLIHIKGVSSVAEDDKAEASGQKAIAIGHDAKAMQDNTLSIGSQANSTGKHAIAIGSASSGSGQRAIAIGSSPDKGAFHGTQAAGQGSIVLGDQASALSESGNSLSPDTRANDAISIGTKASTRATNAIAMGGQLSYTKDNGETIYGKRNNREVGATVGENAHSGIAIGGAYGSIDTNTETIAIEMDAAATYGERGIAIGTGALVANTADFASLEELLGRTDYVNLKDNYNKKYAEYIKRLNEYNSLSNSTNPLVTDAIKEAAHTTLVNAEANMNAARDDFANVIKEKIRLEAVDSVKETDAVAIGTQSNASVRSSVALGSNSKTTNMDRAGIRTGTFGYDVSAGKQYEGADKYSPTWQSTAGSLSIGGGTDPDTGDLVTRRISNVSAGVNDTDAVNVAQLKRVAVYNTDFRNTAIGKDENGNLEITSPYITVQGVKEASDANTLLNNYKNAAEYKKAVSTDIQTLETEQTTLQRDIDTLTNSIGALDQKMAANAANSAEYIAAQQEKEFKVEERTILQRELEELTQTLQSKREEFANAEEKYNQAQEVKQSQAKATGKNAMAFGYASEASGEDSIAMGKGNKATGKQSLAIGTGNEVTGDHSGAIGDPSNINGSNSYSIGNNNKIAKGQDAVFVLGNSVTQTTSNSVFLGSSSAYVEDGKTTAGMSDYSSETINGKTYNFAGGKPAGVVSVGNENETRRIQNVAAGKISADSTDAINGSQLYSAIENVNNTVNNVAGDLSNQISNVAGDLSNQISNVDNRARKGIAGAAALAALHPLDFDPDDKLTFAAGVGHYRGENAAALGLFYRADEKVMFSLGGTVGNGENMVNAGVSFSLDRTPRVTGSRTALTKEVVALREHVARQDAQIAELTALVRQLAGNAGVNMPAASSLPTAMPAMFPDNLDNKWAYDKLEELEQQGYIKGYAGHTLTRSQFAAALDMAMKRGAKLEERLVKAFEPELSHVRVAHVEGNGNEEGKWYERPRFSYDKLEKKHEIKKKNARIVPAKQK